MDQTIDSVTDRCTLPAFDSPYAYQRRFGYTYRLNDNDMSVVTIQDQLQRASTACEEFLAQMVGVTDPHTWRAEQDAAEVARETCQAEQAAQPKADYKQANTLAKRLKKVGIDAGYISEYDPKINLTLDEIETLLGLAENRTV